MKATRLPLFPVAILHLKRMYICCKQCINTLNISHRLFTVLPFNVISRSNLASARIISLKFVLLRLKVELFIEMQTF